MIVVVAVFPFVWMLNVSLKRQVDIFGGADPYPQHPTTGNYSVCSPSTTSGTTC